MKKVSSKNKLISIVAPVYNEEEIIERFIKRTQKVLNLLKYDYELILINDGSKDNSLLKMLSFAKDDKRIKVINFSRNFGHQMAISAGWEYAKGEAVITLDSDLQDPPELIEKLIKKWEEGYEIVSAVRKSREDTFFKKYTAKAFYKLLNSVLVEKIPENVGDYRLIDKKPLLVLKQLKEKDRYLRGLANWVGFKQTWIKFNRSKRTTGKTNYSLIKMFDLALNAVFSFSTLPHKLAHMAWFFSFLVGIALMVYAIVLQFLGLNVPGWASQIFVMIFFGTMQLFILSIVLEYVWRIYIQSQGRPLYIVSDFINF